jgi:hypothetical protein
VSERGREQLAGRFEKFGEDFVFADLHVQFALDVSDQVDERQRIHA